MKRVILASASPRRQELLSQVGIEFETIPSTVDEACTETEPARLVELLAGKKAENVAEGLAGDCIVIGSDTIVTKDGRVLGKPSDKEEAIQMLSDLQGAFHQVYSGVVLISCQDGKSERRSFHVMTEVEVLPMAKQQIADYVASGDCMDKAGAYGIQGAFAEYIKGIHGDYYNVVGLPLSRLMQELRPLL